MQDARGFPPGDILCFVSTLDRDPKRRAVTPEETERIDRPMGMRMFMADGAILAQICSDRRPSEMVGAPER
jgi:hypothetical protein